MALTDENGGGMVMPVAPMGNTGNCGFGFGDNGSFWILLLFILLGNGGWGNGFGGFGGGNDLYPWMNQSNQVNNGFRDQMLNTQISGIQNSTTSGFGDVQTALCGGFAGVNAAIAGAQNGITQQMYANQISDLERSFAAQTASTQGMTALQSQLANCCCENRAATADLKYTISSEACADRAAAQANTQLILDKLCALELDGYKRENDSLRTQLNMANLAASQVEQTAQIRASQATTANQLVNELRSCPIPAQPVYGNTPIFTCGGNNAGCGCGCGA